jgi:hypothetical protein
MLRASGAWFTRSREEVPGKPDRRARQLWHVKPKTARVIAAGCLAAPFVGLLWVPFYGNGPSLGGVPFFYWYQLAWVPLIVLLMSVAYLLLRR